MLSLQRECLEIVSIQIVTWKANWVSYLKKEKLIWIFLGFFGMKENVEWKKNLFIVKEVLYSFSTKE